MARLSSLSEGKDQRCSSHEGDSLCVPSCLPSMCVFLPRVSPSVCLFYVSILCAPFVCPFYLSLLFVPFICPFYLSLLFVPFVCPFCVTHIYLLRMPPFVSPLPCVPCLSVFMIDSRSVLSSSSVGSRLMAIAVFSLMESQEVDFTPVVSWV